MLVLSAADHSILLPFGENTRYDLVIDNGGNFVRVQCKTGRLRKGAIVFATTSAYGHHRNPKTARRAYEGQIDCFAVYCPENGGVYLVPAADLPSRSSAALRVEPARNGQSKGIRSAERYEIARVPISRLAERKSGG